MKRAFWRNLSLFLTVIFCICLFSACSASANADRFDYAEMTNAAQKLTYESQGEELQNDLVLTGTGDTNQSLYTPQDGRKMIRNASLSLETEDYEASLQAIQNKIAETGAYLESSSANGYSEYYSRYTLLTVRVPAEQFDKFLQAQDDFGVVIASEVSQEDVTLYYTDIESRLETLNTKKERLTELLEKADVMTDIIELESALAETISEIESYTAQIKQLDNLIAYCTVTIDVTEVYHATSIDTQSRTLSERIEKRFRNSLKGVGEFFENLVVFFVGNSPVLILLAAVAAVVTVICVSAARRKRRKWEAAVAHRKEEKSTDNPS